MKKFRHTRKALIGFDKTVAARQHAWDTVDSNEGVTACEDADEAALKPVREAFHRDTKEFNSLSACMRVGLDFMRRMVKEDR